LSLPEKTSPQGEANQRPESLCDTAGLLALGQERETFLAQAGRHRRASLSPAVLFVLDGCDL
jgi:hypothetical protein